MKVYTLINLQALMVQRRVEKSHLTVGCKNADISVCLHNDTHLIVVLLDLIAPFRHAMDPGLLFHLQQHSHGHFIHICCYCREHEPCVFFCDDWFADKRTSWRQSGLSWKVKPFSASESVLPRQKGCRVHVYSANAFYVAVNVNTPAPWMFKLSVVMIFDVDVNVNDQLLDLTNSWRV